MSGLRRLFAGRLTAVVVVTVLAGSVAGGPMSRSAADTVPTTTASGPAATSARVFLNGASCGGERCIAVGEEDLSAQVALPFAEVWHRGVWRQVPVPQPSRTTRRMSTLNAISCWSARGCVAVGGFFPSCCQVKPFAEQWTGARWRLRRDLGPRDSPGYQLYGISCPSAHHCTAVGDGNVGSGNIVSLVERWSGARWVRVRSPNPRTSPGSGQAVSLSDVSCADQRDCVAVGSYSNGSRSRTRPLAEIELGAHWVILSPLASRRFNGALQSISCPATTACMAVGESFSRRLRPGLGPRAAWTRPLAELWNGRRWVRQRLPAVAGSQAELVRVACASATNCTALGDTAYGSTAAFAEHWNGHRWRLETIAIPAPGANLQFIGITCTAATNCTAVGQLPASPTASALVTQSFGNRWILPGSTR